MLKRILTLSLILTFVLGLAGVVLAQNQAYVQQVGTPNTSTIVQTGDLNLVDSIQTAASSNNLNVSQVGGSDTVWLEQTTVLGANNAPAVSSITQTGSFNIVVGASGPPAAVNPFSPAIQDTTSGNNLLDVDQSGDSNAVGLFQSAATGNTADFDQTSGLNTAAVYQVSTLGSNSVGVTQTGGDYASVYQSGSGDNIATITQ